MTIFKDLKTFKSLKDLKGGEKKAKSYLNRNNYRTKSITKFKQHSAKNSEERK